MPSSQSTFADILLPVPIPRLFTYEVAAEHAGKAEPGRRVIVPFGHKKVLTGVIVHLHGTKPQNYDAREILDVLDEQPVVVEQQLRLIQWMAGYYMCTPGEVLNAALPSGLKILQVSPKSC